MNAEYTTQGYADQINTLTEENQKLRSIIADWPACEKHWSSQPHAGKSLCPECLVSERDAARSHMDYCRSLLKTPNDEVLAESIKALIAERDASLKACAEMRDVLEEVAQYDSGEQSCVASDAKEALAHAEKLMEEK